MDDVIYHYNSLIDENNDPVHDDPALKEYMDKWDGQRFIESMCLDKNKSVLEIGIGTGRIAVKTAPLCRALTGIDISPKTIVRASKNLSQFHDVKLICGNFMSFEFRESFDIIYSSLTFMHIKDKLSAIKKISSLLNRGGLFVLSLDKNKDEFIDAGTRKIKIYPDDPEKICKYISCFDLSIKKRYETDFAHIIVCQKLL